jgi:ATP-dependent 26S proteasome regulatory subunit
LQPEFGEARLLIGYSLLSLGKNVEAARELDIPVVVINLANMSDTEFIKYYKSISSSGTILLIEDIDTVFNERINVLADSCHTKQLLTFNTLLNALSDTEKNDKVFTIMTANHPEKLDSALIRAGRMNKKIHMDVLSPEAKDYVYCNILRDWPELKEKTISDFDSIYKNGSFAQFQSYCSEKAMELFYGKNE